MNLRCVIVDDEYLAIQVVREYTKQIPDLTVLKDFTHPEEALAYLQSNETDLLFLDIQMPQLDGFELLKKLSRPPLVVFTTARHDYAVKAFDLEVLDYLVKPIPFSRFEKAVAKAKEFLAYKEALRLQKIPSRDSLMFKSDYHIHKVPFHQIDYIEGLSEYVKIYTSEKMYVTLAALKDLLTQLPADQFIRVHKSFIVRIEGIQSFSHQSIKVKNKELPLGRVFKKDFLERMK